MESVTNEVEVATPRLRQRVVAALSRCYPLLSGCGTFANSGMLKRAAGDAHGLAWARVQGGGRVLVPLGDYVGRAAFYVGDLDRKISRLIRRIVREGDTVFDVGANLGIVTMQLAACVGKTGQVHSFEPNPVISDLLSRSLERNQLSQVHLHKFGLGTEPGTLDLAFPEQNAGMGAIQGGESSPVGDDWRHVQVELRTLSDVASELGARDVRLMKIDVEGFEAQVFGGGRSWLESGTPDAIVFEHDIPPRPGTRFGSDPTISMLTELGYRLFSLPRRYLKLALIPVDLEAEDRPQAHDFLAIRAEKCDEILSRVRAR